MYDGSLSVDDFATAVVREAGERAQKSLLP
jgi:hypothetical protein